MFKGSNKGIKWGSYRSRIISTQVLYNIRKEINGTLSCAFNFLACRAYELNYPYHDNIITLFS
jgi:hypothetical protein